MPVLGFISLERGSASAGPEMPISVLVLKKMEQSMNTVSKDHVSCLFSCAALTLWMTASGFAAVSNPQVAHGPTFPPNPWESKVAHGPTFPPNPWESKVAHGPTFPPNPWDGKVAHGPTFPPNPWDGKVAHGPTFPPDPWQRG